MLALIKSGKTAEASGQLEKVLAAYPKDAALHNLRGELLVKQNIYPEAVAEFEQALRLDPGLNATRVNRDLAVSGGIRKSPLE